MASDLHSNGGGADADTTESAAPTGLLLASSAGEHCVNCGTTLSSDQRYCVVCGERRGAPRFSAPAHAGPDQVTEARTQTGAGSTPPRSSRSFGTGMTLIAGVGTLLLAMLVGVLIGHSTASTKTPVKSPPVHVTLNETGSSGSTGSSGATSSAPSTGSSSHKSKTPKAKKSSTKVTKAAAKKEANAASKVTGGSGTPAPTTKLGQKGKGAGYNKKTHKFDGSYFGQ